MKIYFDFEDESFTTVKPQEYDYEFETDLSLEYIEEQYFDLRMYGCTTQMALQNIGVI